MRKQSALQGLFYSLSRARSLESPRILSVCTLRARGSGVCGFCKDHRHFWPGWRASRGGPSCSNPLLGALYTVYTIYTKFLRTLISPRQTQPQPRAPDTFGGSFCSLLSSRLSSLSLRIFCPGCWGYIVCLSSRLLQYKFQAGIFLGLISQRDSSSFVSLLERERTASANSWASVYICIYILYICSLRNRQVVARARIYMAPVRER